MLTQKKLNEIYAKKDQDRKRFIQKYKKLGDSFKHHKCPKDIADYSEVKKPPRMRVKKRRKE